VRYAKDWPGAHTLPGHVGTRTIRVKRPEHYFDPENPDWPDELDYGAELARERIAERVRIKEHQAWNEAKRSGRSFIGPRRVLKLAHTKRAGSYEVFGSLNPQFAAAGHRAAATEAAASLQDAVRTSVGEVDRWRSKRVLPSGHLVDAGLPRSALRARAVANRPRLGGFHGHAMRVAASRCAHARRFAPEGAS
jgi:hypothetical protein